MENKGTSGAAGEAREAATLRNPLGIALIDDGLPAGVGSWITVLSPAKV